MADSRSLTVELAERSSGEDWDAFEESWRAGLEATNDPAAMALAVEREREYHELRRGVLGFGWLILRPA